MSKSYKENIFEFSPASIGNNFFHIPIYQRLYSWEKQQIEQLLQDLLACFEKDDSKDYYIGNLILAQNNLKSHYDLIDGQQRLTTLWLIGFVFKNYCKDWLKFIGVPGKLRISFSTRNSVDQYLSDLVINKEAILTNNENSTMVSAIRFINIFIKENNVKINEFALYVFNHVKLIGVVLPDQTDLNKYFEIMNNRGIQLEKHEILKARLLKEINRDEQERYGIIWNACSQMNKYIEDCFTGEQKIKISNIINKNTDTIDINSMMKIIKDDNIKKNQTTLYDLLNGITGDEKNIDSKEMKKISVSEDDSIDKYSSVCGFPDFLLHVFKIFSKNYEDIKINNKDLLDFIKKENYSTSITEEEFSKRFIESLFLFRILFDNYIIKGVTATASDYKWQIRKLERKNDAVNFYREHDAANIKVEQIQSMLYVSTQAEHWLTPALMYINNNYNLSTFNHTSFTEWLELIDDNLALERLNVSPKLLKTTNEILENLDSVKNIKKTYNDSWNKGIYTERYWYFKLDYCLLKKYYLDPAKDERIEKFRFKANNSVEHVHAQSQRNENERWDSVLLNSFGNLSLISISANSEYNDQSFNDKKADFESRSKKYGYDSLKLFEIYNNHNEWNKDNCKKHEKVMINILNEYHNTYTSETINYD